MEEQVNNSTNDYRETLRLILKAANKRPTRGGGPDFKTEAQAIIAERHPDIKSS